MDYYNQNNRGQENLVLPQVGDQAVARNFLANVFGLMFMALGISALFAYLFASSPSLLAYLYTVNEYGQARPSMLGYIAMFAPLGFVLLMSFGMNRLSAPVMVFLFVLYSIITGISFSYILIVFKIGSVVGCFLSAAAMFGIMAVMGYTTKQDLTKFGRILMMGLIGIIVAMLINMFMRSSGLDYIISIIGVMIFTGLTAYDVQKLKNIGAGLAYEDIPSTHVKKLSVLGALNLYLDFINIFLFLLRLFGGRRD